MSVRAHVRSLAGSMLPRPLVNRLLRGVLTVVGTERFDVLMGRGHRLPGYRYVVGNGIEIGALHAPASLPKGCRVTYVDAITTERARTLFPEVDAKRLVPVEIVADLDADGLRRCASATFDFAVMNHVIEHVANPIKVLEELFRVVKPGGTVVISAPDKRFSFDAPRELTTFEHLLNEYKANVRSIDDDHYLDFVRATQPDLKDDKGIQEQVDAARRRREHAHVWDANTFDAFLDQALRLLDIKVTCLYRSWGDDNRLEHFSAWQKTG